MEKFDGTLACENWYAQGRVQQNGAEAPWGKPSRRGVPLQAGTSVAIMCST